MPDQDPLEMLSKVMDQQSTIVGSATIATGYGSDSVMDGFLTGMRDGAGEIRQGVAKYNQAMADLDAQSHKMPAEGLELERLRVRDGLEQTLERATKKMSAHQTIGESHATQKAIPKIPKDTGEQQLLRDELRMILDGVDDGSVEDVVRKMASGDRRDLAALAASRWGRAYVESRGVENAADVHRRMVEGIALQAEHNDHASDMERAASRALKILRNEGPGLRAAATQYGRMTINDREHVRKANKAREAEYQRLARQYH